MEKQTVKYDKKKFQKITITHDTINDTKTNLILSVCLSVCLFTTSRKNYCSDLHERFTTIVDLGKEVPIKFWKSDPDTESGSDPPWQRSALR